MSVIALLLWAILAGIGVIKVSTDMYWLIWALLIVAWQIEFKEAK